MQSPQSESAKEKVLSPLLFFSIGVSLIAASLIILSCTTPPPSPTATPHNIPTPPPWETLPTRIPSPTPTSKVTNPMQTFQAAQARGDTSESTQILWETLATLAPDDGIIWREGARLALARDELDVAEARIWHATSLIPKDAETWALLGLILEQQATPQAAIQALDVAQTLDSDLMPEIFAEKWHIALQIKDTDTLQALAQAYKQAYPDDPLATYYRAETFLVMNNVHAARDLLRRNIDQNAPAVLWYTLGRTYARLAAWNEALIAYEVAKVRQTQGDTSLRLASRTPLHVLDKALGEAYLYAEQCAKAEPLLRSLSTPYPELAPLIRKAVICQTPTPTWTPWILSQQATSTPG